MEQVKQLINSQKKTTYTVVAGAFALTLVLISMVYGGWVLLATGLLIGVAILYAYPSIGFSLLVPALFLEADSLSLDLPIGRIRVYHLIILVLFLRTVTDVILEKKKWRKTVLDVPIVVYLVINAATIFLAPDKAIALKIMGLIGLMALLYWSVVNYVTNEQKLTKLINWFLGSAFMVGLIGLFQVGAEWLEQNFGISLWSGQVVHSDIIPYGRPFGTFVEPDWFGTFIMIAVIISGTYFLARAYKEKQMGNLLISGYFGLLTILSAVRGAWLGLAVALVALVWLNKKYLKAVNFKLVVPIIIAGIVIIVASMVVLPELTSAITDRLLTLSTLSTVAGEPRFITMQSGWEIWKSSAWLGYGPGAFKTLGVIPFVSEIQALTMNLEAFQTNAFLTVMVDTGLIGLAVFLWMSLRYFKKVISTLKQFTKNAPQAVKTERGSLYVKVLALFVAVIGLAVAYQVTAGLWLGLSWFLVALSMAGAYLLESATKAKGEHAQ